MRSPPLPLNAGKGDPLGDLVMEEAPIVCGVEKPVRAQDPASKPARQRGPSGRSDEAMLALCPSFYRRAEQREAPALYDDLTDGGRISACQAVSRFPWQQATLESRAAVYGRMLDLLPRERCAAAWSCGVCDLYAIMLEDFHPPFRRVRSAAFELHGVVFSLVPRRGKFGWRRRARWAGLRLK